MLILVLILFCAVLLHDYLTDLKSAKTLGKVVYFAMMAISFALHTLFTHVHASIPTQAVMKVLDAMFNIKSRL